MTLQRFMAATTGAWLVAAALSAQQEPRQTEAQQRPLFRAGSRFVRVDVFPTDREGRRVEGLTAADFELFEDGKRQEIDSFEFVRIEPDVEEARVDPNTQREGEEQAKDPRARLFVVVLDKWHVEILGGAQIRRPLTDMLDRLIGPRDLFGVITPQMRPSDLILGRKTITVADMLDRHWTWGGRGSITDRDAIQEFIEDCYGLATGPGGFAESTLPGELIARSRERQTLEHLDGLVRKLGAIRDEKKVVIVFTQGWRQFGPNDAAMRQLQARSIPGIYSGGGRISARPMNPNPGQIVDSANCESQSMALLMMDNRQYFRNLLSEAQRANVSFYPVDPRGLAVWDTPASQGPPRSAITDANILRGRRDGLIELANNTDGEPLINSNDLSGTLRRLADGLSTYYLLGYYSTNTKFDGGYRRIEVKVRRPDIRLKARRGYFAPTQDEINAIESGRAAAAVPPPAEAAAFSAALGRLDEIRHDRDLFVQAARVPGALIVTAELGVNARQAAEWQKGGELRLMISGGGGTIAETRPIDPLKPGVVLRVAIAAAEDVRIDARARAAGGGAADAVATLPPASPGLIGDVLSYRGLARSLMPAPDGRYRRTERATIEAPLADGAIQAGARLLDKQGKPLNVPAVARERVDAHGVRWLVAEISLAPLTEGDYVIELEATKDEARERKLFAIRVVR